MWGSSDFLGGLASRRAAAFGVVLVVQAGGAVLAFVLAQASGEGIGTPDTWALPAVAGLGGGVGLLALYHGLGVGRMGIVAPVTGLLAAALPVVVGMVRDGIPGPTLIAGIALALVAVVVVSRVAGESGQRSGLEFGIVAGFGFAAFNIAVGFLPDDASFAPLVPLKLGAAALIAVVVVAGRRTWTLPRPVLPLAIGAAVLDLAGNAFYVLATQAGRLDVAVTLSSLYPVTTVILAALILRERMSRSHAVGIVLAGVAIVLISAGSGA